jgi:predicted ATPase
VHALLAKRPNDRPPSAEAVLHTLAGLASLSAPALVEVVAAPRADTVFRAGLIGRNAELDSLNGYLEQAWAGEGKLIVIEGEAGVGKTRLANELGGQVRLRGGSCLIGACHEAERVPYAPVAEWLDDAFRSTEDFGALLSGLELELARLVPRLLPAGAASAEAGLDPQQARLRFFDAVLRALLRLSVRRPLMLLLDDIQWVDEATLELLHYLVRNARGQRIFVCATARREDRDASAALTALLRDLSRLRLFERIELDRLSPQATSDLIAAMLGLDESPSGLADRIYTESEGNPFFVEEILKALAEEGLLLRRAGRWQLQADVGLTMLRIPATIVDVIERRLAHLSETERGVLNWAAVLGYEFVYNILHPASDIEEGALLDLLDSLLRGQLVVEVRDPRQDKYRFAHAKIREVVYGALSGARRKRMHRAVGEAIEKVYAARLEEMSPILAHHFTEAADLPKAVRYNVQAGERARRVYANQEAIAFYRQAIRLQASEDQPLPEYLINAHRGLGDVYYLIGEYEQAAASFRTIIDLASQMEGHEPVIAEAWRGLGQTNEKLSEYGEALHAYEQGLSSLGSSDGEERARLLNAMAWVYVRQGEYEQARRQCDEAIALAHDVPDIVAAAYQQLGISSNFQGDFERAIDYHLRSLALREKAGAKPEVAQSLNWLGNIAEARGDYNQAVEYYQKSLALCQEIGHSLGTATLFNNLGVIYQDRGELDFAHDHFRQSLGIYQRIGNKDGVAMAYGNLAEIYIARGEIDPAMNYLLEAESITQELGDKVGLTYTWMLMAEARLSERRLNEAQHYALQALELADEGGLYAGKAHRLLGQIHLESGQVEQSRQHLGAASKIFSDIGSQIELERTFDLLKRIDAVD